MAFETKYSTEWQEKRERDRFQVEFNEDERKLFTDMQLELQQAKDSTALKQWAFYGWFAFSNPHEANRYLKHRYFKNKKNNERLGLDVKTEIQNKFRTKKT